MTLGDLLSANRIAAPLEEVSGLGEVIHRLLDRVAGDEPDRRRALRSALDRPSEAELLRVHPDVLLLVVATDGVENVDVALGLASEPFPVEWRGDAEPDAKALFLAVTPDRVTTLRVQLYRPLIRLLENRKVAGPLLEARSSDDVRSVRELMETPVREQLRVEHAMGPLTYRVYPDTPLGEVVDLMARKRLRAVPVVGQSHEVLGIITSGEALRHFLQDRRAREGDEDEAEAAPVPARDVMSRSVMCVAEDEDLFDAANLMVNKKVAQLPVVREGEIVGFLNRDDVLRVLVGASGGDR